MQRTEIRYLKQFTVKTASGGSDIVEVYQPFTNIAAMGDAGAIPGKKTMVLRSTGRLVNWVAKGHYEDVITQETLLSDDPDAE